MPIHNLIEFSDNYSDTSGSLWKFKRSTSPVTDAGNPENHANRHLLNTNQVFHENQLLMEY